MYIYDCCAYVNSQTMRYSENIIYVFIPDPKDNHYVITYTLQSISELLSCQSSATDMHAFICKDIHESIHA